MVTQCHTVSLGDRDSHQLPGNTGDPQPQSNALNKKAAQMDHGLELQATQGLVLTWSFSIQGWERLI